MSVIDTSKSYVLTNAYTQAQKHLAAPADSATIIMQAANSTSPFVESAVPRNEQWFLTATSMPPFYRLHTVSGGAGLALDILNDVGTGSTRLRMASTSSATGQYWRLDSWDAGSDFRLSNNYSGLDMHLDVYSDTMEPHLAKGDLSGQHWTLNELGSGTPASTTSANPTSSETGTSVPQVAKDPVLTVPAIAGIAAGGAVLLLLIALVIFIMRRRSSRRRQLVAGGTISRGDAEVRAGWDEKEMAMGPAELHTLPTYQSPMHLEKSGRGQDEYGAFLAELPGPPRAELADTASVQSELEDTGRRPRL